jgi:hypothetical protein
MAVRDKFKGIVDGDQLDDGYFQGIAGQALTNNIINQLNTTVTYKNDNLYTDDLTADSADTKTNWTYDGTNDLYYNEQTSLATLDFQTLLSIDQKEMLAGTEDTVVLYVDWFDAGDNTASIVTNEGFETAGGGGADVFGTWAETAGSGTFTQSTSNVIAGTYSGKFLASGSTDITGTLTQTIDVTNVHFITINYTIDTVVSSADTFASTLTMAAGAATNNFSQTQVGVGTESNTGVLVVDCRAVTGSQTLTLTFFHDDQSTGTGSSSFYVDDIKTFSVATTANSTVGYSVSPNGSSSYETVVPGVPTTLSSVITDLGIKITETRTDAQTSVKSEVKAIGIFWK